ncbi:MAG: hypothetical protein HXX13_18545 [Bacteroidetes bacterium]|nr:hypothetical protein [Bacteroidota bacterium]
MGLFNNLFKSKRVDTQSRSVRVLKRADLLLEVIRESIEIAKVTPDVDDKKARLEYAMKHVIELIALSNRYPIVNLKSLSTYYASIREIRNEIKLIQTVGVPYNKLEVA